MEVKENCYVRLWDYENKEALECKIVEQTMKTHYIGGTVGTHGYRMQSEQVLSSGGDGKQTISLRSKLGLAIDRKKVGDVVEYTSERGFKERFKIVGISLDGSDWTNIITDPVEFKDCPNCGQPLVKRKGRYGEFYGCSGYPECKYTENRKG